MGFSFEAWHLWVMLGLVLAGLEMLGLGFVALAIGVSCIAGAVAAAMQQPLWIQLLATAVTSAVVAPLFVRWYRRSHAVRDRVSVAGDSGSKGLLCTIVSRDGRLGVVIKGDFFPAQLVQRTASELQAGQQVSIQEFSGITAMVTVVDGELKPH